MRYQGRMTFSELRRHLTELELIESVIGTLGWDEQTYLPKAGAELRGAQTALLSRLAHERQTDPRIEGWLATLDLGDPIQAACARNLGRSFRRERRVSGELVERLAKIRSEGFAAWIEAKKTGDFAAFRPTLEQLVAISIERARAIDPARHPYEVLLEQYDPGTQIEDLRAMFARLREGLLPLLAAIASRPVPPRLQVPLSVDAQWTFNQKLSGALGYDFDAGRMDPAEHPFSTGHGKGDVRITTHLYETDFLGGLGSTIHETGHAMYEQGLPHEHAGTTVREAASYGLHESQSRFWENAVGRSRAFARFLLPRVKESFPALGLDEAQLFSSLNRVERGLIRVSADEVTYNLHIIVRFELELALFEGTLAAKDVPGAWDEKMQTYLGITPPNDGLGCLQDVHWSAGLFGYFPSYTLGNLYAASLGKVMRASIGDFDGHIERGDFAPILSWLRQHVHQVGHLYEAPEIVRLAVGEQDHVANLLAYLWERMAEAYGVTR